MSNPILLGAKINMKRSSLTTVEDKLKELLNKRSELEGAIDGVETEEDLTALESDVTANDEELKLTEEEQSQLEKEIEELEKELEELNAKKPTNNRSKELGGKGKMENLEIRNSINEFIRTKGSVQERKFTTIEGGALIPEELLKPQVVPTEEINLTTFINVVNVNSGSGKYPVIKHSDGKMVSVAELEANPKLGNPTITKVDYDVETYRGYIPVAQETIDDADYDISGLISNEIRLQELNTKNTAIATVLKTATPKAVTGIDGLKEVFNKSLKRIYSSGAKAIITASMFNELDTTKDKNGRYLLQDDITVPSGKKLFGYEVIVLDDTVIGDLANDLKGFIGNPKAFATLFDRKQVSIKWVDHNVYGQLLAAFTRFDVEKVDTDAGFYVTYTPDAEAI